MEIPKIFRIFTLSQTTKGKDFLKSINKMATKNQTMELARNIIAELDKEIASKKSIIRMIEKDEQYVGEIREILIQDWTDNLRTLERLREFVIYKA